MFAFDVAFAVAFVFRCCVRLLFSCCFADAFAFAFASTFAFAFAFAVAFVCAVGYVFFRVSICVVFVAACVVRFASRVPLRVCLLCCAVLILNSICCFVLSRCVFVAGVAFLFVSNCFVCLA